MRSTLVPVPFYIFRFVIQITAGRIPSVLLDVRTENRGVHRLPVDRELS
jgi:hypothetical protein